MVTRQLANLLRPFVVPTASRERSGETRNPRSGGFTLLELIIVVALIGLILTALIIAINPNQQFAKARDAKRKSDLAQLKKTFEDYYNDKNCYPKPQEVCTDGLNGDGSQNPICTICSNTFSPYMTKLPCDPEHPQRRYLYRVDPAETVCPTNFRLYAILSNVTDPIINELGCYGSGCGPYGDSSYGVSSPNVELEYNGNITPTPTPTAGPSPTPNPTPTPDPSGNYQCCSVNEPSTCNFCGTYQSCLNDVLGGNCRSNEEIFPIDTPNCNALCN